MKILHTSDWHIGKKLGRHDRMDEYAAVIDEVMAVAEAEEVDLVVHSGDLFDRAVPPLDALQLGLASLVALAAGGSRPVVVVAGNHDSADLFETLRPLMEPFGVHLRGEVQRPDEGGVVELALPSGRALVACLPFLREGRVVDFMADTGRWYGQYAERIRLLTDVYAAHLLENGDDAVTVLAAHFLVTGVRVGGEGAARGERELHMGEAYTADAAAVPASLSYVAMGHIHAPQPIPGASVPGEYAGSLVQLDFGEAGETKRVVIVEASAGRPATIRSVELAQARPLVRARGTLEDLRARQSELAGAYLDLTVETSGPSPGLFDEVRVIFPDLVKVRPEYERAEVNEVRTSKLPWDQAYVQFHLDEYGTEPPGAVLAAFREVLEEVESAPA
jgi:exonuclease SbcD